MNGLADALELFEQFRQYIADHNADYNNTVTAGLIGLALWFIGWSLKTISVKSVKLSWGAICGVGIAMLKVARWFKPTPPIPSELSLIIIDALREADAKMDGPCTVVVGNCRIQILSSGMSVPYIDCIDVTGRLRYDELTAISEEAKKVRSRCYEEETQRLADSLVASLVKKTEQLPGLINVPIQAPVLPCLAKRSTC